MKKIFMALIIVVAFSVWSNFAEAAGFTPEQLDKLVDFIGQDPALSPENNSTLKFDAAKFRKSFNAELEHVLDKTHFKDDEEREVMERLFLIKDFQVFESESSKFLLNVFGNNVAIFGVAGKNDRFKILSCAYTVPETKDESTLASLILVSFVKVLAPKDEPEEFLRELTTAQSGNVTHDGTKFSFRKEDNFVLLSASAGK